MPFHAYISLNGGRSNSKGGPLHKMSYGQMAITPRNLGSALLQVKSQCDLGSGSLSGKRQHSPITIVREVDSSSPLLWQGLCTNEVLQSVDINLVRRPPSGGGEVVVPTIHLTNAAISGSNKYAGSPLGQPSSSGAGGKPSSGGGEVVVERITLTNAVISSVHRFTPHLGPSRNVHDTNELEEIQLVFQKIVFSNVSGSTSTSDDWTSNTG